MILKDYQQEAVIKLKSTCNDLLGLSGKKSIVFKAPTGSGKTVMMAEFLKEWVENRVDGKKFSFIWTAPRQLHIQSKNSLEKYFEDSKALKCSYFEDLTDKRIGPAEILFLNWESINKDDNIYVRDNEQDYNLSNIVNNTLDQGNEIILVVDESHHTSLTPNTQGLIEMMQPKLSIEVSATPSISGDERVTVYREKVIEEGMIKKQVSINPGFKNEIEESLDGYKLVSEEISESTNEFVLRNALKKRDELIQYYKEEGVSINPLLLIQLPDSRRGVEDIKDELVDILNKNHSISVDKGNLAIYLSENKENLENIQRHDSDVDVMIFKQAIALGWDCPRAHILALFRDWKSITFSIQTVGRILRMPEQKHYVNEDLNTGFIFTNLADISIERDIAGKYLTTNYAKRKPEYENICLKSVYSKRFREETRLNPSFSKHFISAANELELSENISFLEGEIKKKIITDGEVIDPDQEFEHIIKEQGDLFENRKADITKRTLTDTEVQKLFDNFIYETLRLIGLGPEERSFNRIKTSIYRFFDNEFPFKYPSKSSAIQKIVLAEKNRQKFIDVIGRAKEAYFAEIEKGKKELIITESWEVPRTLNYSEIYRRREVNKCILVPFFESNLASTVEKEFVSILESKDDIVWWFKNGDRDNTYFAVSYVDSEDEKPFYVDWIIKFKSGELGLYDTKSGITAETAGKRANGLAKYIKEENLKEKKLKGGIITKIDGSWRYNDQEEYEYNASDFRKWKFF